MVPLRRSWPVLDWRWAVVGSPGVALPGARPSDSEKIGDLRPGVALDACLSNGTAQPSRRLVDQAREKVKIDASVARGNGLLGVRVHSIKDLGGKTDSYGTNPLPAAYNGNSGSARGAWFGSS